MNRFKSILFAGTVLASFAIGTRAGENVSGHSTPDPWPSQLQTHLRIDVKDDTKNIHLINSKVDPNIITKCYVLQNADPYELLPYFQTAVQAEQIAGTPAKVECIKYNDGTGILIVSAEDYRFGKQANGMGFDDVVAILDKPGVKASSGTVGYAYFPKYVSAAWLYNALSKVGMNQSNSLELMGGKDKMVVDYSLNALFVYVPPYQVKNINEMIKQYDVPVSEVKVKYTVYELDVESNGNLGVDFQAWKNGPGTDLFSIAGRFGHQWDFVNNAVNYPFNNASHTQYLHFSPKWNSKYLDLLAAKSKAAVITSGTVSIKNNLEARIEATQRVPGFRDGKKTPDISVISYIRLSDKRIYDSVTGSQITPDNTGALDDRYRFQAVDDNGITITISGRNGTIGANTPGGGVDTPYRGDLQITKMFDGTRYYYECELNEQEAAAQGVQFSKLVNPRDATGALPANADGQYYGYKIKCFNVKLERLTSSLAPSVGGSANANAQTVYTYVWATYDKYDSSENFTISRDYQRDTAIDTLGFVMTLKPVSCEKSTKIDLAMSNSSLIGYFDGGAPRISKSEISTQLMVNNNGTEFIVGGVDKKAIVNSVNKIPWLGDLPLLGWILGSESSITKKTQLVAVITCEPVMPETKIPEEMSKEAKAMTDKILQAEDKLLNVGYDQYLFDSEKKGVDPLP